MTFVILIWIKALVTWIGLVGRYVMRPDAGWSACNRSAAPILQAFSIGRVGHWLILYSLLEKRHRHLELQSLHKAIIPDLYLPSGHSMAAGSHASAALDAEAGRMLDLSNMC
jgi:hypothetical protein